MPLILLTDDNDINRFFAARVLKKMGLVPDEAVNGLQAVKMSSEKKYDIILMDIQMPEMDGIEATKIILGRDRDNSPAIIAITANASGADISEYKKAGFCDMVAKPYKPDQLINLINYWSRKDTAASTVNSSLEFSSADYPVFDNTNLLTWAGELGEDPKEFVKESLNNFIVQSTKIIESLSILPGLDELRIAAHTLKGSALTMGANALGNCAKELEFAVKEARHGEILPLIEQLRKEFARFLQVASQV